MHRVFAHLLRACIVVALGLGLFGQVVVIPATAAREAAAFPPYAPFAAPYAAVAIAGIACVQLALVAGWVLLTLFLRGAIFSAWAVRSVDVIIGCSLLWAVLASGVAGHLLLAEIPSPDGGRAVIGALGTAIASAGGGVAVAMLVVLARGLLRQAAQPHPKTA